MSHHFRSGPAPRLGSITLLALGLAVLLFMGCQTAVVAPVARPEPQAARAALDAAWAKLWSNDFKAAGEAFRGVAASWPGSAEAWRGDGLSRYALGDLFDAEKALETALAMDPADPLSTVLRRFIDRNIPYQKAIAGRMLTIDRNLASRYPDTPIGREAGRALLAHARDMSFDAKALGDQAKLLGYLDDWSIVGPFPNVSGAGFDREYIKEDLGTLIGQNLPSFCGSWLGVVDADPAGVVNVADRLYSSASSVYYGKTTFQAAADGQYRFILDAEGAVKLWVDGELLYVDRDYAGGQEQGWVVKQLGKGLHRIQVKIAERSMRAWFRVAAIPAAIDRQPANPDFCARGAGLIDGLPGQVRDPVLAVLAVRLAREHRVEDAFWLSWQMASQGHVDGIERELYQTKPAVSGSVGPFSLLPAGSSYRDLVAGMIHERRDRQDDARNAFVRSVSAGAAFAPAFDYLLAEARDDHRDGEVERLLKLSRERTGERIMSMLAEFQLALSRKDKATAGTLMDSLNSRWPGTALAYLAKADSGLQNLSMGEIAEDLAEMGLKYAATRILFNDAEYREDGRLSYQYSSDLLRVNPSNTWWARRQLDSGLSAGELKLSDYVDRVVKLGDQYPGSMDITHWVRIKVSNFWSFVTDVNAALDKGKKNKDFERLADELHDLRGKFAARELAATPGNYDLRMAMRAWDDKPDLADPAALKDPLAIVAADRAARAVNGGDVIILSDESKELHFADGGFHAVRNLVLRVDSPAGVRAQSTQYLDSFGIARDYRVLMAYTIKPDGARIRAREGQWSLSFPSLASGDYLVLSYVLDGERTGALKPYVWTSVAINGRYPVVRKSCTIVYPDTNELKFARHRLDGITVNETRSTAEPGLNSITFEAKDLPAVVWSANSTDARDKQSWIDASSVPDWNTIVSWYADLAYGRTEPTPEILRRAHDLSLDCVTDEQTIAKMFNFASTSIAYEDLDFQYSPYVPQWAASVASDGFGDCKDKSALLVSLLAAKGIAADLALSQPDYTGDETFLPSPRFSHVFVLIGSGAETRVLDPTSDQLTYPFPPSGLSGTPYLRIPRVPASVAGLERVNAVKAEKSGIAIRLSQVNDVWMASGTLSLRGDHAAYLRSLNQARDQAENRDNTQVFLGAILPGLKLDQFSYAGTDGVESNPVLTFSGSLEFKPDPANRRLSLVPGWFIGLPRDLSARLALRKDGLPFELQYPSLNTALRQTWIIELPATYQADQPLNQEICFKDAYFSYSGRQSGSILVQERESYLPSQRVSAGELEDLVGFVSKVQQNDRQLASLERK